MFKKIIISGLLPMLGKIDKYPASSAKANHQCQIKIPSITIIKTNIADIKILQYILCCLFLGHRYGCVFVIAC